MRYKDHWNKQQATIKKNFQKNKVDMVSISTDEDYVKALINLFRMRG
jgi:phosphopantetheinyl transferase (holo-ACP synthase)